VDQGREKVFFPYFEEFISRRVEELTIEAEKKPDFLQERSNLQTLIDEAAKAMGMEAVDLLISAVRGLDVFVSEYIYCTGIKDGIYFADYMDRIKENR